MPEPAGVPPEPPTQTLFTAKHPAAKLIPCANVLVAVPVTSSNVAVVEPVPESSEKIDDDVVAKVVTDEVEK